MLPARAAGPETPAQVSTPAGSLFGTARIPPNVPQPPVVLIVAGSGPVDRDGNSLGVRTDMYKLLAAALSDAGIASIRYDKRGVGASAAAGRDETKLRFDDYVADAAAWIARLRANGHFGQIAIAGHSEGSLVGMLAAQRAPVDAFVSLAGAGFPAADVLRKQLQPKLAAIPSLASASDRIIDALAHGRTDTDVPADLNALFRPAIQPYLISWFRYDPRGEIAKVRGSVTIVQGTADIQTTIADAQALVAALPAAKLVSIDGMSHVLKDAPNQNADQQVRTVYADPSLPIDPAVPKAIAAAFQR